MGGQAAGQGGVAGQPLHKVLAVGFGREVLHYQHRRTQRGGEAGHKFDQRRHATGRGAYNNEVGRRSHRNAKKEELFYGGLTQKDKRARVFR
ncbi:hypothetical protein GCM10027345_06190 [Hymenobacter daeguensis]